ncbi:hypothetical protein TOK_4079 [Pseudonocardia sp. N23]|nr:hypothetical protein TOK_4079 [Pseudonocardia sp. N23]
MLPPGAMEDAMSPERVGEGRRVHSTSSPGPAPQAWSRRRHVDYGRTGAALCR